MDEEPELRGTFACPICGIDKPHHHSDEQVAAYHEDQIHRDDGWTSTQHRQPKERGWYLCLGIKIDPDQYGKPKDFGASHERWYQLSWFLWVRNGGEGGSLSREIPEVLCYNPSDGGWHLRNLLGNAVRSGAESRFLVHAQPKYWRELPAIRRSRNSADG